MNSPERAAIVLTQSSKPSPNPKFPPGLSMSDDVPSMEHNVSPPRTPSPPPADLIPPPLRYPETLNTVIAVRATESKGLGIFALHDLPPRTLLLAEAPLITLIDTGSRADPLDLAVSLLSPTQRASFHSLHGFSRNPNESLNRSIVYSNGYSIRSDLATGVFETASRINHSCVPNSQYQWKEELGRMVFWNRFKLLEGEEVTVDYGHRKRWLEKIYGFECSCGGCTEDGSSDARSSGSSRSEVGAGEKMASIDELVGNGLMLDQNRDMM